MGHTLDIMSLGHAAENLQATIGKIRRAAEAIGIRPSYCINGVDHFDEADVERIRAYLARGGDREAGGQAGGATR